jgi:acetylornithine aminotransferase
MTLAKALANGLPIGAMLATEEAARAFVPGSHASTFGGTPLVTCVALEVLRLLTEEKLLEQVVRNGAHLKEQLSVLQQKHAVVKEVRGYGLMLGLELAIAGAPLIKGFMEKGFLVNCVQDNVLRLAPPLVITQSEIDAFIECLDTLLCDVEK